MVSIPSGRDAWSKIECWVSRGSFSLICIAILLCTRASVELGKYRTVVNDCGMAVGVDRAVADGMLVPVSSFDSITAKKV